MELVQELLLTVLIAALVSFLVAKLVSVAADYGSSVVSKDDSGRCVYSGSSAMEEVKFEDRLRAPDFESDDRVQFVEEEMTINRVDQFDAGKFVLLEAEVEERIGRGEEIGVDGCDERHEAPDRLSEAAFGEEVNVGRITEVEPSDAPTKSPECIIAREAAFEEKLSIFEEIQTEPCDAPRQPLECTELPQKSPVDVELHDKLAEEDKSIQLEVEIGPSSAEEEVKREDTVIPEPAETTAHVARLEAKPAEVQEDSDEDDWEGIERSELAKDFAVAANYFGSGGDTNDVGGNDVKMQLYGLHKVATEGPCYEPQPMALKVTARATWNAWQRLGNMSPDAAMEQYITILSVNLPSWKEGNHPWGPTEADIPTPESELNTKPVHQPNIAEDRIGGASNASLLLLLHNDAVIKNESLVAKAEK